MTIRSPSNSTSSVHALGFGQLKELDDAELDVLFEALAAFEQRVSSDRRERFDRLDA